MLLNLRNISCGGKGANYHPIETTSSLPLANITVLQLNYDQPWEPMNFLF